MLAKDCAQRITDLAQGDTLVDGFDDWWHQIVAAFGGLVQALQRIGAPAPFGVEVFSEALSMRPCHEVASETGDALRALLSDAL